jgi:hypothetical protein
VCFFFLTLDDRSAGRAPAGVQQLPGIDPEKQGQENEDQASGAPDDDSPRPASALVFDVLTFRLIVPAHRDSPRWHRSK